MKVSIEKNFAAKAQNEMGGLTLPNSTMEDKKLKEACMDFEAIFIEKMFESMKKTVVKGEMFHGGMAEDMFVSMQNREYAKIASRSGDLGLSMMIYNSLKGEGYKSGSKNQSKI